MILKDYDIYSLIHSYKTDFTLEFIEFENWKLLKAMIYTLEYTYGSPGILLKQIEI